MSLYVDEKYIGLVSSKLDLFKRKGRSLWNFRCPICNDSSKSKYKARGYIYERENLFFYRCHNCGYSTTFEKFLETIDNFLYKEYSLEKIKSLGSKKEVSSYNFTQPFNSQPLNINSFKIDLDSIADLHHRHFAKTYIESRKIPVQFHKQLFFAPDFKKFIEKMNPEKSKNLKLYDPRIVIPFYTPGGDLLAVQGRSLEDSKVRYITIKRTEYKDSLLMFGLERVNKDSLVYIVEGPFDSYFLPNCIAAAGSELIRIQSMFENKIFIFDNEPYNKEVCKNMAFAISRNNKVVVWPINLKEKDINDMILKGMNVEQLINKNVYQGLEAQAKLAFWRKA